MLVAKLVTPIEKIYQESSGIGIHKILCSYISAKVMQYDLDGDGTVYYKLGKLDLEANEHEKFKKLIHGFLELNKEDVATWGTDDAELLRIVASKLDLEVEEVFELEGEWFKQ